MDRIYDQAKDKNVAAILIYVKSGETKAYADSACTIQFKTSELADAFYKRALIKSGNDYYAPTAFTVSNKIGSVSYAVTTAADSSTKTELKALTAAAD